MNPNSCAFVGLPTEIDLLVKVLGHGVVYERNGDGRADLWDQDEVLDQQQVVGCRNSKATHLSVTEVSHEQEFRPGCRTEP